MQYEAAPDHADTQAMARIIFDSALLESGYIIKSPKEFNARIYDLLARTHDIKADLSAPIEFDDSVRPASCPSAFSGTLGRQARWLFCGGVVEVVWLGSLESGLYLAHDHGTELHWHDTRDF